MLSFHRFLLLAFIIIFYMYSGVGSLNLGFVALNHSNQEGLPDKQYEQSALRYFGISKEFPNTFCRSLIELSDLLIDLGEYEQAHKELVSSLPQINRYKCSENATNNLFMTAYLVNDLATLETIQLSFVHDTTYLQQVRDAYLRKQKFDQAFVWANFLNNQNTSDENQFVVLYSAVKSKSVSAKQYLSKGKNLSPSFVVGKDTLMIAGGKFRYTLMPSNDMVYGTILAYPKDNSNGWGTFWSAGKAGIAVFVQSDGYYKVTLNMRHNFPPPIDINVFVDGNVYPVSLHKGDNSWEMFSVKEYLPHGWHSIEVQFIDDGMSNGINKDAYIKSIEIRLDQQ